MTKKERLTLLAVLKDTRTIVVRTYKLTPDEGNCLRDDLDHHIDAIEKAEDD